MRIPRGAMLALMTALAAILATGRASPASARRVPEMPPPWGVGYVVGLAAVFATPPACVNFVRAPSPPEAFTVATPVPVKTVALFRLVTSEIRDEPSH